MCLSDFEFFQARKHGRVHEIFHTMEMRSTDFAIEFQCHRRSGACTGPNVNAPDTSLPGGKTCKPSDAICRVCRARTQTVPVRVSVTKSTPDCYNNGTLREAQAVRDGNYAIHGSDPSGACAYMSHLSSSQVRSRELSREHVYLGCSRTMGSLHYRPHAHTHAGGHVAKRVSGEPHITVVKRGPARHSAGVRCLRSHFPI